MNIDEIIKTKQIKLTTARLVLLEILKSANKPLSYEDIKSDISMDKATFYRNIGKFEEQGILNSFESNDKKRYFELRLIPHAHFVCVNCNKIECLSDLEIKLDGYLVNNVIVNGKCKDCVLNPN
ncbi:MAG: Fur family ferric uptake transcriptional regulator [Arcobacteraceae bacterium]|jgi:Fur family ferric uptake transcriptional regulator